MQERTLKMLECKKCGNQWFPRSPSTPKLCPYCKNKKWWEPKKGRAKDFKEGEA